MAERENWDMVLIPKKTRKPDGPLASVKGRRDVTDRPWWKVIVVVIVVTSIVLATFVLEILLPKWF